MYDLPEFGLEQGDRLEPCENMMDIAEFDVIDMFPIVVLFWRTSLQRPTHHRNPIFNKDLETSPVTEPRFQCNNFAFI